MAVCKTAQVSGRARRISAASRRSLSAAPRGQPRVRPCVSRHGGHLFCPLRSGLQALGLSLPALDLLLHAVPLPPRGLELPARSEIALRSARPRQALACETRESACARHAAAAGLSLALCVDAAPTTHFSASVSCLSRSAAVPSSSLTRDSEALSLARRSLTVASGMSSTSSACLDSSTAACAGDLPSSPCL